MKRQVLFMMLLCMICIGASAHDIEVANADGVTIYYNYSADGKELIVTYRGNKYDSYNDEYSGVVVIPEEVTYMNRTRKVTSIGNYAFWGCSGLTSVTIGNSVMSIGNQAFLGCSGLTSVTIGNSVSNIGDAAFQDCFALTVITIPNSVKSIGSSAFYKCTALTSIIIPNSVIEIGGWAFYGCTALTSVHITDLAAWFNINFLPSDAGYWSNPLFYAEHLFVDGKEMTDLIIPNNITKIGNYAFICCSGLTSLTIGNNVTEIGRNAFAGCSSLKSVTIPNSVASIGVCAFDGCI